ncbi:MAG: hypothetical protein NW207_06925 [Cytophagales bacterium]|nr:hypothetical protein [Cytophagales bacterium]
MNIKKIKLLPKTEIKSGVTALFWCVVILSLIAWVDKKQSEKVCQSLTINIENELNNYFVEDTDIQALITTQGHDNIVGEPQKYIILKKLEQKVTSNQLIDKAIISKTLRGNVIARVVQCKPILRISTPNGDGRYLSDKGKILPLSSRYTARLPIFTGPYLHKLTAKNMWATDTLCAPYMNFLKYAMQDDMLNKMITMCYIDTHGEITIYPQIGKQTILFGKPDANTYLKLMMMKTFYEKIVPVKGWNTFSRVTLKFNKQIICE